MNKPIKKEEQKYTDGDLHAEISQVFSHPERIPAWNYCVYWKDNEGWWHVDSFGYEKEFLDAMEKIRISMRNLTE